MYSSRVALVASALLALQSLMPWGPRLHAMDLPEITSESEEGFHDRLSAFTSHRKLAVTPAIGYADRIRSDSVMIEYRPTVAMRLLDKLVSESEVKTVGPR